MPVADMSLLIFMRTSFIQFSHCSSRCLTAPSAILCSHLPHHTHYSEVCLRNVVNAEYYSILIEYKLFIWQTSYWIFKNCFRWHEVIHGSICFSSPLSSDPWRIITPAGNDQSVVNFNRDTRQQHLCLIITWHQFKAHLLMELVIRWSFAWKLFSSQIAGWFYSTSTQKQTCFRVDPEFWKL